MYIRQKETIQYIINQIEDICILDTDPKLMALFDTNILIACLEVSIRILSCSDEQKNVDLSHKLKKFYLDELIPSLGQLPFDEIII